MRRLRLLIVLSMVLTPFVVSTGVAYGYISWGWHWNAAISVGDETMVYTKWTVAGGDARDYTAEIKVSAEDPQVMKVAPNETVTLKDKGGCVVKATYVVSGPSVEGTNTPVIVQLVTGDDLRSDKPTGKLGKKVSVSLNICDDD